MTAEASPPTAAGPFSIAPFSIALTGGIASGKTTVSDTFAELGAAIVDTDLIAREVVAPDTDGLKQVVRAFGQQVLKDNGELDRECLRRRVFSDAGQRRTLEAIIHPLVKAETRRRLLELSGAPYAIVVVPLLLEAGMQDDFDRVLVVDASENTQLQRLMRRDGVDEALAKDMLEAQTGRQQRLAVADDVITNDSDMASLKRKIRRLHSTYLSS